MRTLHIIHSVSPLNGGPIEFIRQLVIFNRQQTDAIEIDVASLDDPSSPWVKEFPTPVQAMSALELSYGFCPRLITWLQRHRANYDIVVVHGIWQFHSLATWQVLRKTKTPYVIFTHGMLDPWFGRAYPLKHVKKVLYWRLFEAPVLRDASAVLFTAQEECERSRHAFSPYKCRELVVGFGVDAPLESIDQRALFLQRYPHLQKKELLLFLGRMHEKKGCDLLLRAFALIVDRYPNAHLVMAGPDNGSYGENLKRGFSGSSITWTGMLSGDLKWGALKAASALILPSHQENFGVAVVEALATGTPVLLSNRVNIWREIACDDAGYVEKDDLDGTIKLLERWFATSEEGKEKMSSNATRCFSTRFQMSMVYHRLIGEFEHIIAAERSN